MEIPSELGHRIARLAADRASGASDILGEVLRILREARERGVPTVPVARAVIAAHPSMAPVWRAALEAVASDAQPDRLDRFAQRVSRAPAALTRFAAACLGQPGRRSALHFVTVSSSGAVEMVIAATRQDQPIRVSCSDSRPALEGRGLASRLAAAGVAVTLFSDAAIGHALTGADALLLGADAVSPEWVLNKSGSRMAAGLAAHLGVPVYVAASRDKFVGPALAAQLVVREGAPAEIWDSPPAGVEVRNPYFEAVPLDLVTAVISDLGVLGAGVVPDVCRAADDAAVLQALEVVGGGRR